MSALWTAAGSVTEDGDALSWLRSRGLESAAIEDQDLARVLPAKGNLPRWARFRGHPWTESGHRLIVRMFGPVGKVESLHARALTVAEPGAKAASPCGTEVRGLAMANPLAQLMLAREPLGDGTSAAELVTQTGLWIAEGLPDFLTLASNWSDADDHAPAVLGVIAGSWTEAFAARIPDTAEVIIATDPDEAGEKYAARIISTLTNRRRVKRWTAPRCA